MAKMMRRMEIEPSANGGHTVTHHYRETPTHSAKSGLSMSYQEPESHVFGSGEGHAMLAHVANALQIPEVTEKMDDEGE